MHLKRCQVLYLPLLLLLACKLVSTSPCPLDIDNGGSHHHQNYPTPPAGAISASLPSSAGVIPCPVSKKAVTFTLHNWQNHTYTREGGGGEGEGEVNAISFHLSTSFDSLSTFCQGSFYEGNGETPCSHNSNRYNTSFGLTNTVAMGGYVYVNHSFRCSLARRNRKRFRIVEALAWVNILLRDVPEQGTSRRYGAELKLYLNTTGVPG